MKEMIFISNGVPNKDFICPKKGEVVQVLPEEHSLYKDDYYIIIGYEHASTGEEQIFHKRHLAELLEPTKHEFSNSVTKELTREFKEVPERIEKPQKQES